MKAGDVFLTADRDRITVRRVARNQQWADVEVAQPNGATWTKRQPLRDGAFAFRVYVVHTEDGERA